jgi:3-oxo-5-alpha-steroid 4-dehydrogenase 1
MATLATTEGLIPNWFPPNRENYERILFIWQLFPLVRVPHP